MSKTYIAVQRSGQKENELTHYKYIKREKKNGMWRYFYDYKLTGKGYKKDADELNEKSKRIYSYGISKINDDPRNYDEYYNKTLPKKHELDSQAAGYREQAQGAIIPKAKRNIQNAIWDVEITIESLPSNIVDKGRMAAATILAGKASDYLVNDILSKTKTKQVSTRNWVYKSTDNGLTRMTKKEARLRKKYGDEFYEKYHSDDY